MSFLLEHAALIAVGASLLLVLWGALSLSAGYPPKTVSDSLLNRREQALVAAIGDAFFPAEGPIPISGSSAGVVPYFDGYLRRSCKRSRFLMHLLFEFMEFGPLLFGPKRRRFTRLSHPDQVRFLRDAFSSRIYFRRVSFTSLRALMTMAYLANDAVAQHLGMKFEPNPYGLDDSGNTPNESGVRAKAKALSNIGRVEADGPSTAEAS